MTISREEILEAIEVGSFLFPDMPGRVRRLPIDGVFGYDTSVSHPTTNMIGLADLTEENASATVDRIVDFYADRAFGWLLGPNTRPANLEEILCAKGLKKTVELSGMCTHTLALEVPLNPEIYIRESCPDDFELAVDLMARAFPMAVDACRLYTSAYLLEARETLRTRVYFAYLEGHDQPVSIGYTVYFDKYPIVQLAGAATLTGYRGRGIYTALVQRRLADAAAEGAEIAVIQAVKNTSAPVCEDLGFTPLCSLAMFVSDPSEDAA